MYFPKSFLLLVASAGLLDGVVAAAGGKGGQGGQGGGQAAAAASASAAAAAAAQQSAAAGSNNGGTATASQGAQGLALDPAVVQTASASIGNVNVTAGEADSATSTDNFINICQGKTLTNGQQVQAGSCNGIPMGDIPAIQNMVTTLIVNPKVNDNIPANTDFSFQAQTANLQAGTFTNAATTYYSATQQLNTQGQIIGHVHFTAQKLDDLTQTTPPDPQTFAFFKGVDDAGNGQGLLSATVAGGLPAGTYRVCTLSSAANHQPVIMPVAQRGAQDDCQKFTVSAGGGGAADTAAAAATSGTANANAATGNAAAAQAANGKAGAKGRQRGRFAKRDFIA